MSRNARALIEEDYDVHRQAELLRSLSRSEGESHEPRGHLCADPGVPVFGTKGSSVHVQEIVRAWRGTGAAVTVYCTLLGTERPSDLADLDVVEVKPESVPASARERAVQDAALGLADEVLRNGCGLFYERYSLFSPALSVVARILDVPSVLEVNAPPIEEQQGTASCSM